jgi:hypothetical protein
MMVGQSGQQANSMFSSHALFCNEAAHIEQATALNLADSLNCEPRDLLRKSDIFNIETTRAHVGFFGCADRPMGVGEYLHARRGYPPIDQDGTNSQPK